VIVWSFTADDLIKFNTTRAHMEADVINIASSPTLAPADLKEFTSILSQLIEHCGYDPNGGEWDIPLLISCPTSHVQIDMHT